MSTPATHNTVFTYGESLYLHMIVEGLDDPAISASFQVRALDAESMQEIASTDEGTITINDTVIVVSLSPEIAQSRLDARKMRYQLLITTETYTFILLSGVITVRW